jgi:hypothetical protein
MIISMVIVSFARKFVLFQSDDRQIFYFGKGIINQKQRIKNVSIGCFR